MVLSCQAQGTSRDAHWCLQSL